MNSCNPVFIGLGQKIGKEKYYNYLEKFGFLNKTGIDLIGEANSIFLKEEKVGPVELATISFGQRFEVTPIQMIAMAGTIGNGGKYVKPRLVKKIIDSSSSAVFAGWFPSGVSGFKSGLILNELWLLTSDKVSSPYADKINSQKSLYVPAYQAYLPNGISKFKKLIKDNK